MEAPRRPIVNGTKSSNKSPGGFHVGLGEVMCFAGGVVVVELLRLAFEFCQGSASEASSCVCVPCWAHRPGVCC